MADTATTTLALVPDDYRVLRAVRDHPVYRSDGGRYAYNQAGGNRALSRVRTDALIALGHAELDATSRVHLTDSGKAELDAYIDARLRNPTAHGLPGCPRHPGGGEAS